MEEFLKSIKQYNDRIAFKVLDGDNSVNVTYDQFIIEAEQCAYNLEANIGSLEEKKIGIYANSSYEYAVILCAVIFSRAIAVPLNVHENVENIKYEIGKVDLDYLIVDEQRSAIKKQIETGVINIDEVLADRGGITELHDFDDDEELSASLIIFTSGTTGYPKGVVITAGNIFKNRQSMYDSNVNFEKNDALNIYINFPYYHVGGINSWITHFEEGVTTYLSTNPGNILSDLENEQIDSAVVTPATLKLLKKTINRGHIERLGGAKLVVTAGAPIDVNTVETFLSNGIQYGQYYGMSESFGNVSMNFDCKEHLKSVGKSAPNVKVTIDDGEICVSGPGVMQGYYKNEEETGKCIIDGILHTGDLGYIDKDGYIYITGRKKNLIILSGGENVSPEELERELYKCSLIYECKVYAENDRICTLIYTDDNCKDSVQEYITDLNARLPIYKRIYRRTYQNTPLEKTGSGKIKRDSKA